MSAQATPAPSGRKPSRRASVHRPSSDCTRFHMSKAAVDRSVEMFFKMTDLQCVKHMAKIRWGSSTRVTCPHCNSSAEHYWSTKERRWKCKGCGKRFSVTSNTVYANRRMPLQVLLAGLHLWAAGAAGQPALELRRMLEFGAYNTAFTLLSKLREGLLRGFNTGLLSGLVEMDGAHASGRRASEKRGRPLSFLSPEERAEAIDNALLTDSARKKKRRAEKAEAVAAGANLHPEYGTAFPASRRITFTVRRRSGIKGKGSEFTRIGVGLAETPDVAQAMAEAYVAIPESILSTDTGTAFPSLGKKFQLHLQVNHSQRLVGPEGQHVNNSESFTARMDRAERGVFLNIEPKHLTDYAAEMAFREDHRRLGPGAISDRALHWALSVGQSHYWRGFTHGKHRGFEILVTGNRPAKASGPRKGASPVAGVNGRLPR